jgi:hypothetical protein
MRLATDQERPYTKAGIKAFTKGENGGASLEIADGVHALYFTYKGRGAMDFLDFTLG